MSCKHAHKHIHTHALTHSLTHSHTYAHTYTHTTTHTNTLTVSVKACLNNFGLPPAFFKFKSKPLENKVDYNSLQNASSRATMKPHPYQVTYVRRSGHFRQVLALHSDYYRDCVLLYAITTAEWVYGVGYVSTVMCTQAQGECQSQASHLRPYFE